jgi:hypothetical protein
MTVKLNHFEMPSDVNGFRMNRCQLLEIDFR